MQCHNNTNTITSTNQPSTPTNQPIIPVVPVSPINTRSTTRNTTTRTEVDRAHPRVNLTALILPQFRRANAKRRLVFPQPHVGGCKETEYYKNHKDDDDYSRTHPTLAC